MYLVLIKPHGYYVNQHKSLKVFQKCLEKFLSTIILWLKKELVIYFLHKNKGQYNKILIIYKGS